MPHRITHALGNSVGVLALSRSDINLYDKKYPFLLCAGLIVLCYELDNTQTSTAVPGLTYFLTVAPLRRFCLPSVPVDLKIEIKKILTAAN